jgi:hypothetical protein
MHNVFFCYAAHGQGAPHDLGPNIQIIPRIGGHDRLAGSPGRRVNFFYFGERDGEKAKGINLAHIVLGCKGQTMKVAKRADILLIQILFLDALAIKRDTEKACHERGETFFLQGAHSLLREAFGITHKIYPLALNTSFIEWQSLLREAKARQGKIRGIRLQGQSRAPPGPEG